ncbi:type IV secretory system conjugative DNA transfer family protein [Amycolatopsis sp. RTGN1]|uniref:type IV secretory system conjugative DNA transfer family protein n=1 Tax=Amycolatopsis ponsaeliensis TaxID=2992142 RepID=UPI00254D2350|nr:type IV secretory system conjugative DNA transfer family protein [Amycolatopsis sp. RTGN1]
MTQPDQQPQAAPQTPPRPLVGVFYPMVFALLLGIVLAGLLGAALSGLLTGGGWAWPPARALPGVVVRWVADAADPAAAWRADPRPGPAALTYVMAGLVALAEAACWVWFSTWRRAVRRRRAEKRSGLAPQATVDKRLSQKAIAKTAVRLRPSLAQQRKLDPDQAGARFAVQRGTRNPLFASHEDSKLVVAPVRMGKTGRQAVLDIMLAPGSVVATSTRFDLLELTIIERQELGTVWVFDPEGRTPWPRKLRWSPIAGCEDYDTALRRAVAICSARPLGDTKGGGYFGGSAEGVMAALLHAAALSESGVDELRLWTTTKSRRPEQILDTNPRAAFGVAAELRGILDSAASSNDSSGAGAIYSTLALLLRPLASPKTRDACTPRPGEPQLDIDALIRSGSDTLYLVSRGRKNSAAPIVNALMSEVLHRAEVLSQFQTEEQMASPAFADGDLRLDPPLRIVMDEAANVSPQEDLSMRLADSGGRGIELYVFVQSFSQLRQRWGPEQATEIWDNASVKLILGGLSNTRDLEAMSRLLQERAIDQTSVSTGPDRSQVQVSQRYQSALPVNEIRELIDGQALLFYRNMAATIVDLPGWWETPDLAERVQRSRTKTRQLVAASGGVMPAEPAEDDPPDETEEPGDE